MYNSNFNRKQTRSGSVFGKSKKSPFTLAKLYSFLPYLIGLVVSLWVFPKIYRLLLTAVNKAQSDTLASTTETSNTISLIENSNYQTQQQKADSITTDKAIQSATISIVNDLGVNHKDNGNWYDVLNPLGWTENDNEIGDTLIKYHASYTVMQRLYNRCYTNSRNLREDLIKYLDLDVQKRVKKARPTFNF